MNSSRKACEAIVLSLLVGLFVACGSEATEGLTAGDATAETSDAGADEDAAETDGAETYGAETDGAETDTPETDTPERDAGGDAADDGGDGGEVECERNTDCPPRHGCVEGECRLRCGTDIECDDANPCTDDLCEEGFCSAQHVAPRIADELSGDCKALACVTGELEVVPDDTDIPEDDGIGCTIERCAGTFPQHNPVHSLCDDGDDDNGEEICSPADGGCVLGERPDWYCDEFLPGWGPEEICDDGQDNDGNGQVDEDCGCEFGSAQRCYQGPPNSREIGGCLDGYQRCIDRRDPHWGDCEGGILPSLEICDLKDNDCNGCVDDLPECEPLLTCPTEDFARPLRAYPLDGTAIFGGEGLEWQWTIIPPPNSATTGAESPTSSLTEVYLDVSGDYHVSLTVRDDKDDLYGCSWVVHVAGSGLRIEMRWDTFGTVDMDLHLHRSGRTTGFCTDDDCYFANCRVGGFGGGLPWGYPDSPSTECESDGAPCNNPRLDIDNIRGFDPENINIDNPNDGDSFRIMAHKYSGSARTNPVLSLYCGGRLRGVLGEAPDEAGLTQSSGGCQGHTWRIADAIMVVDPDTGVTDCVVDVLTGGDGGWDIRLNSSAY